MGWNTVEVPGGHPLFEGVEGERFYFVHSYGVREWTLRTQGRTREPLVTWAEHGGDRFVAAVENGPLSATQFHPEKSGDAGARLLANWVATLVSTPMSKERARKREEREREAAVRARPEPPRRSAASVGRRGPAPCAGTRPTGCRAAGRWGATPGRWPAGAGSGAGCCSPLLVALNVLVWVVRPRLGGTAGGGGGHRCWRSRCWRCWCCAVAERPPRRRGPRRATAP